MEFSLVFTGIECAAWWVLTLRLKGTASSPVGQLRAYCYISSHW
jgi:hypothetical protein